MTRNRHYWVRRLGVALLIGLSLIVVVAACGGGAEKASVTGMFTVNGTPQAGWDVFLGKDGVDVVGGTNADASGRFQLSGLDEGSYTLSTVLSDDVNPYLTCTAPGFRVTSPNTENPAYALAGKAFPVDAGDKIVKDITVICK
jgi:hypothetical protein